MHLYFNSPIGGIALQASERGLKSVCLGQKPKTKTGDHHPLLELARQQLTEYLSGQRTEFNVPLDLQGTDFQQRVWRMLCDIPYGQTRSYGEIARQLNQPKATQAVGAANGKNPLAIIIPCHRVIGKDGSLTGYAGGLAMKQRLLELEGIEVA